VTQHVDLLLTEKKEQQVVFAHKNVVDERVVVVLKILAGRSIVVACSEVMDTVEPALVERMTDPAVVLDLLLVVV